MLGGGDGVAEGRVHDDHTIAGAGVDVDIVDADTGAADDLQVAGLFQQFRRHLGRGADGEAIVVRDHVRQFVGGQLA